MEFGVPFWGCFLKGTENSFFHMWKHKDLGKHLVLFKRYPWQLSPKKKNPLSASLGKVLEKSQHVGIKKTTGTEQKYVLKMRKPTGTRLQAE